MRYLILVLTIWLAGCLDASVCPTPVTGPAQITGVNLAFDPSMTEEDVEVTIAAARAWESHACGRQIFAFTIWPSQPENLSLRRLHVSRKPEHPTRWGWIGGSEIEFYRPVESPIALHELGHALGLVYGNPEDPTHDDSGRSTVMNLHISGDLNAFDGEKLREVWPCL